MWHQIEVQGRPVTLYLILHDLLARYDHIWTFSPIIIYVDDIHLHLFMHFLSADFETMHDLSFELNTLKAYHSQVNLATNVTIMRLEGKSI